MNTFNLNNHSIRYFSHDGVIWFITADANKAFGFKGKNTHLDLGSIRLEDLSKYRQSILRPEKNSGNLPNDTLIITSFNLLKTLGRSDKPDLSGTVDAIFHLADAMLTQQLTPNRLALPSADTQVDHLAGAAKAKYSSVNLTELPEWKTVTEILDDLGEKSEDENSLNQDNQFRYWINRHLSDLYRAQCGEEPPTVSRRKGIAYAYPPEFITTAKRYLKQWRQGIMVA